MKGRGACVHGVEGGGEREEEEEQARVVYVLCLCVCLVCCVLFVCGRVFV